MLTTRLESASYVEMTRQTLGKFGIHLEKMDEAGCGVEGGQRYRSPGSAVVEGDWSNAAFFLAAGAMGGDVTVEGLSAASPQGDRAICGLLRSFGARAEADGAGAAVSAGGLRAAEIDVSGIPDILPVLAVVASAARGTSRLVNAARLRMKESDRLHTVAVMLNGLGADVREQADSLLIRGRPFLTGGTVDGAADHRIVMAAALASVWCRNPVTILGAEAGSKSYPRFFDDFNAMGGNACVFSDRQED